MLKTLISISALATLSAPAHAVGKATFNDLQHQFLFDFFGAMLAGNQRVQVGVDRGSVAANKPGRVGEDRGAGRGGRHTLRPYTRLEGKRQAVRVCSREPGPAIEALASLRYEHRPEIVYVRARRSGDNAIAERLEERVRIVPGQRVLWFHALGERARKGVG